MEPISAIVISLALGARDIVGDEVVRLAAADAYKKLKALIKVRYPQVSVDPIEQAPTSQARRAVLEEDLTAAGAINDADLIEAARKLIDIIEKHKPTAAQAIGIDLKDVSAASMRLSDIAASSTGVKVNKGTFSGDIDIRGIRAGVSPTDRKKDLLNDV